MADDRLSIDYTHSDVHVLAHVHLADPEPALLTNGGGIPKADVRNIHRVRLRAADVRSKAALARLLEHHSRASEELWLNCGDDVWLKLLELLDVRAPFPDPIRWTRES